MEKQDRIRRNYFINQNEVEFMEKVGNRKLVCYGASSRWRDINQVIYIVDLVEFFVDGDSNKWGKGYCGKEVKNPEEIRNLDMKEYAVVVLAAAFEEISKTLDEMGLVRGIDYFNIFQYFNISFGRPIASMNKFLRFLDTVPNEMREVVARKGGDKIGIVMSVEGLSRDATDIPYTVSLFLILKWKGYNVKLIVDRLCWEGDIVLHEGRSRICNEITDMLIRKLEKMVPKDDILYIDALGESSISDADEKECERVAEYSTRWLKWQNLYNPRYISQETLQVKLAQIYKRNIGYIDTFFEKNHFDTINASTGLHVRGGIYNYVGKKRNIRVSSQDGIGGTMLICANGPASYGKDIPLTVERKRTREEEEEIIQRAVAMWEKRRGLTIDNENLKQYVKLLQTDGYAYIGFQAPQTKIEQIYDVVIPLNISEDGAALGRDTLFGNKEQWLIETLDFVINKLGKTVLLREHPAGRIQPEGTACTELYAANPDILEPYKDNPSLYYVKSDEDINLYQYIGQCKVVAPWTSTVGMEAGIMKKNVLLHTNPFYGDSAFVLRAHSRKEYFELLEKCILGNGWMVKDEQAAFYDALKYFYYAMSTSLVTNFTSLNANGDSYEWKFEAFEDLLCAEGVDEIVQIVAENVPSAYLIEKQHRRIYNS